MTHIRSGPRRGGRTVLALAATAALLVSGAVGASLSGTAQAAPPPDGIVNIVDTDASPETRSLWSYLEDTRGEGILFGHQHDIDNGLTFTEADGVKSDILAGTGDYPAVFGWDTLILEGLEAPGLPGNTGAQNVTAFAGGLKQAHRLGGISTISAHMKNFVTGNDFNDSSGRVVSHILPGGDKNAEFNEYLDLIADTANAAVDDAGNLIPIIFRPFHENTGSWFWWGAAHATVGEYKEIFRYTVEYLRDTKDVSNFLYAFSPNGTFGGEAERYLTTYPGDEWVDIMGYDRYEGNNDAADSDEWIADTVTDLAMLSDLADEHGRIAAFTEFGRNGERTIKPTGNKSLNFYTDVLTAIKNDPKAKNMAFMLTWSNWGTDQFYIPYPAYDGVPEHEMFQDFLAFYNDPYTVFASNIPADALTRDVEAADAGSTLRLVSPADGVRVTTVAPIVRVKATVEAPTRVWFTVEGDETEYDLTLGGEGYYSAVWNLDEADLSNKTVQLTVHATYATEDPREVTSSIILGDAPILPVGEIDDFEGYGDDAALQAAVAFNNAPSSILTLGEGESGSKGATFAYDFTTRDYQGFGKVLRGGQDWSAFNRMNLWLDPDGSDQKLVLQLKAGGQTFEAYPSLAGTDPTEVSIHFNDFRPPPWDSANADKRVTQQLLKSVTEFYVFMNKVGTPAPGSISLDNIKAVAGEGESVPGGGVTTPPTEPPAGTSGIDDFESYADDAALRAAWDRRDNENDLSLADPISGKGTQAMRLAFDFSSVTYAGVARSLTADWSGHDQITGWLLPDGSNQQVVFQFKAGGVLYELYTSTAGTEATEFTLALADAVPASYQKLDPERRPSAEELKSVTELAVFITKASDTLTGAVVLDDLRVSKAEGPVTTPTPTPTATATPTPTATATATATTMPTSTVTATATVTVTSSPPSGDDVYTTPGYHNVNGRKWFTTCEPYSVTWRCTTEIWATSVTLKAGTFEKSSGWFFNNLTYLPSKRTAWAKNPLGNTGSWTSTEGRQWRTECDTAVTGGNGCRSYIKAKVVQASKRPGGYSYAMVEKWIFNNIVLFS